MSVNPSTTGVGPRRTSSSTPKTSAEVIIALINEALELSVVAVQFDNTGNYVGATDYYDMAVLNFNEALNKLPIGSPAWTEIMEIRSKYDDRLEVLRHYEVSRNSISSMVVNAVSVSGQPNSHGRQRRPSMSRVKFEDDSEVIDMKTCSSSFEQPPTAMARVPYWQMRAIAVSIKSGGYLSPTLYAPRMMWLQSGSKFSGLSVKISSFDQISSFILEKIDPLPLSSDESSLEFASTVLSSLYSDMNTIQNSLSKAFNFIPECVVPELQEKSQVGRFSSMLSAVTKNVRKYAEVTSARLSAMSMKASTSEIAQYISSISTLCDKAQIFDKWYVFLMDQREVLFRQEHSNDKRIIMLESLLANIINISTLMRDVVCELLLRDIEQLLDRYLRKMRKSFSRMHWDEDGGEIDPTEFIEEVSAGLSLS